MLRTKSIFEPKADEDGMRISIMSRHTLNDGVTPDPRIKPGEAFDVHWVELAPPSVLVGKWYRGQVSWGEFRHQYLQKLARNGAKERVAELKEVVSKGTATFLCVEPLGENCHRRIAAEHCKTQIPDLEVMHV